MIKKLSITKDVRYVLIPVHRKEDQHWALAILCNVNQQLEAGKDHLDKPCILYMDSLLKINKKIQHTLQTTLKIILNRLHHSDLDPLDQKPRISYFSMRLNLPRQYNSFDCGIYLLEYAERFMLDPKTFLNDPNLILYPDNDRLEYAAIKINRLYNEKDRDGIIEIL